MKVMKFGGTSVGTAESLRNVKNIVESDRANKRIVVVSALGGITDKLLATARTAATGSLEYIVSYAEIVNRHLTMIREIVPECHQSAVRSMINPLLEELGNIFRGISLIKEASERTLDVVVSYGERMSSIIVSHVIENAILLDSREFIVTKRVHGKHVLDTELTTERVIQNFRKDFTVAVAPGFISRDVNGDVTNLGRGGSDFTAAILAAELGADILEIWTDVDGFMTADPRAIKTAKVIDRLSFSEAMELCNYGAKVIYPPTIYPVFRRNIPIVVKNTFNPSAKGTEIFDSIARESDYPVKGISTIAEIDIVSLAGSGVEMIQDITPRIYESLSRKGIEPLFVSLAFSDGRINVVCRSVEATKVVDIMTDTFFSELQNGALSEISSTSGFSMLTIVGDNMDKEPGIVGKLSLELQQSSIPVAASSQGMINNKMHYVVEKSILHDALASLHRKCFESGL